MGYSVLTQICKFLNFYQRGPQGGNSIELVEILFETMTFLHFTQRTIYKSLALHLIMHIYTGYVEIIKNNTTRK